MAPLMGAIVIAAAIFFAIVTLVRFGAVEARLNAVRPAPPAIDWRGDLQPSSMSEQLELANSIARYQMEREVVARRYETAALAYSSRLWTRFMGFLTGMLLAFVGAVFVLGKLESEASEMGAQAPGLSLSLKSASPGIILAGLGTLLMALSILVPATTETHEGAIYLLSSQSLAPPDPPITSAMLESDEPQLRDKKEAP